ncbi:MAG: hypothetical protein K8I02_10860, partial [Candidatus Methylomirabilis sp.]|nr:hypothetical protein [Deltaproteobacteria bacterium]
MRTRIPVLGIVLAAALAAPSSAPAYTVNVTADAGMVVRPVKKEIFGHRFEWSGVANGYPSTTSSQAGYFDAMRRLGSYMPAVWEMRPTVLHYPAGLPANVFPWKKSIGRFDARQVLLVSQKGGYPDNLIAFGLDEFMSVVEDMGAEAIIAVPMQVTGVAPDLTGTFQDNADLVEYLNSPNDGSNPSPTGLAPNDPNNIDWAARRAANGHPEPYGVKYFEMGVEIRHGLFWSSATYANFFCIYSDWMRAIDPTISFGVVGDDAPFYFDAIQPVGFRFEKWFEITGNFIDQFCTGDGIDRIGFWQRHPYSPGTVKPGRGPTLSAQGKFLDLEVDFPATDDWTFNIYASGGGEFSPGPADLGVYVDGVQQTVITVSDVDFHPVTLPITAGTHTIRFRKEDPDDGAGGNVLRFFHRTEVYNTARTERFFMDWKDADLLHPIIQAGADYQILNLDEPAQWLQGKPVYVTEFNAIYEERRFACEDLGYCEVPGVDLREALQVAGYYEYFIQAGQELALIHQLFDQQQFGLIEGVATDLSPGVSNWGRDASDIRRRPTHSMVKLFRDNTLDQVVFAGSDSPTYPMGPSLGMSMGSAGIFVETDIPWFTQTATVSDDGTEFAVILRNKSKDEDAQATISLGGFAFAPTARLQVWTGPETRSNNEGLPEACSNPPACTPQVGTTESNFAVPGGMFVYTVPRHSIVAFKFFQNGADKTPPAAPAGFQGSINGSNDQVTLSWNVSADPDFASYRVYKAANLNGPFGRVVATLPQGTTQFVDTD